MRNKKHCPALLANVLHFVQTFSLKTRVSDCKHFIDEENVRLEMSGHGKCQP